MDFATALFWITLRFGELQQPRIAETIIVDGGPALQVPQAVTTLTVEALQSTPAATLDDALRSVPGFSLFRRSSSRVANPTTQGATLRGLAASGSSRALVVADGAPLNDPVGGWVYWNRVPLASLQEASVARGAAGADAVGGTIVLDTADHGGARVFAEVGEDDSRRVSAYAGRRSDRGSLFGSAEGFTTDGFVIVAPESRGAIDTPAGSRYGSGHLAGTKRSGWNFTTFRASHFYESRKNGTPFQTNSTRITQVSTESLTADWRLRGYAQVQRYEQTFSAVLTGRNAERPTSAQAVTASAFGASADARWSPLQTDLTVSGRHVRAHLRETEFTADGSRLTPTGVEPAQTTLAFSAQRTWDTTRWSAGAGARTELWQSSLEETNRHVFFNPRLWITYRLAGGARLNAALQSGFRGPTLNELYRPFRVGNTVTRANALLKPEGVHGVEVGLSRYQARTWLRVLGFWSGVDDAIVNVTLSSSGGTIVRERQNAARIRARGIEVELESRVAAWLTLTASSAYTDSVFVSGPLQDLRVPQVPKTHRALGGRGVVGRARWSAEWRFIDEQFDDDRNVFALDDSSMLDARVGWMLNRRIEIFGAIENVLDEEQDVGRTPIRTVGLPRTSRLGLRWVF